MSTTVELEKTITDLSDEAFNIFLDDIATMFDVGTSGSQIEASKTTLSELKKKYRQKCGIWSVSGQGVVNGEFFLLANNEGLFTLAGTFVMQPEQIILQNRTRGNAETATDLGDAIGEVGNLMVGSWDRAFRENSSDHIHFKQSGTILNDTWQETKKMIPGDSDEVFAVTYQMKVEPFEPFTCAVFYPAETFSPKAESQAESVPEPKAETKVQEPTQKADSETNEKADTKPAAAESKDVEKKDSQETPKPTENIEESKQENAETAAEEQKQPQTEKKTEAIKEEEPEPTTQEQDVPENAEDDKENQTAPEPEPVQEQHDQPVTKAIKELIKRDSNNISINLTAEQIMKKDIVWASQDDTVEKVMNLMQQKNVEYILVGDGSNPQGIVANGDIQAALSPYLKPMFSKWKRPLDTATLQIKVKWIMSQPVHSINPNASFQEICHKMHKNHLSSLPVVDANSKVLGIISIFDILGAL